MTTSQAVETRDLKALAEQAGRDLEDASPLEILTWAAGAFGKKFAVTSSMEDAVVAHLASRAFPAWTWSSSTRATTSRRPSAPATRSRP